MPPTDLAAVRAAAEQIRSWMHVDKSPQDHPWWALDMRDLVKAESQAEMILVDYILQTIPADATLPITAEWLREVWDKLGGEVDMQSGHPVFVHSEMIGCLCLYGDSYDWRFDGCIIATITTRHQFTQLAACLGIQPQPPEAKGAL